jgi:hypothetical protein
LSQKRVCLMELDHPLPPPPALSPNSIIDAILHLENSNRSVAFL